MVRMVIPRVSVLFSAICSKVLLVLLVVLRLASRMLRMVIPAVGVLMSGICLKVSLFCAANCKVAF